MIGPADRRLLQGPAGAIEVVVDAPQPPRPGAAVVASAAPAGLALIAHPHPLYGGTLDNKVAATLARALASLGWFAVRFNFRGVGASAGVYDDGRGETDDLLWLIDALPREADIGAALAPRSYDVAAPQTQSVAALPPLALAGFSFGSFVVARAAARLAAAARPVRHLVLVGAAAGKWPMPAVPPETIVIHGEKDETIALDAVLRWAAPLELPVIVMPEADHFFHRRLGTLKALVVRNLLGSP